MVLKINPPSLGALADGARGVIASLELSEDDRGWIDALGLSPGREVTVLRRAAFGGPLHVRLDTGAEFALDATLAECVVLAGCEA